MIQNLEQELEGTDAEESSEKGDDKGELQVRSRKGRNKKDRATQ